MLNWYLGTMGYGYKDWLAVFYPAGAKPADYLPHYSQRFNAVEMDTTYYGTPRPELIHKWAAQVPAGFKFCPKTPREISHERLFKDALAPMSQFLDTMRLLGDKLGAILIQCPPELTIANLTRLQTFLAQLPTDLRYAVEFRHPSWHHKATGEMLQSQRMAWVSAEYIHLPQRIYVTTDFLYIRWLGQHGTYQRKDHEREDKTNRLKGWWADIQSRLNEGFDTIYGFFNNDYAGHSPTTCQKFKGIIGLAEEAAPQPKLL